VHKPTISVLLPFRNATDTLPRALLGLLASSEPNIEVLAIDDGSSDDGPQRVQTWAARDARLRLIEGTGKGLVAALNVGLKHVRGDFVARMDADDISHPLRLQKQHQRLVRDPSIGVVATRVRAFADEGTVGEGLQRYIEWQNGLLSPDDHQRELFVEAPICHPSVMMRREALQHVGGYRETDGPEDYDLWLRLDAAGVRFAKLPEVLLAWRHDASRTTFRDPRYALTQFRAAKAPFLTKRVRAAGKSRVVMWGAGPTGRKLARELEDSGLCCELFIDIDPRKIGRRTRGATIAEASALDADRDAVIVAVGARGARDLIRPELHGRGFREGVDYWFAA
jgi:glycosyltransferase involved in cell wall biosynthesis